ncbi:MULTISPECIES: MetQ/NlpA family ABC transporter substrate-binding protein [Bacillaceae]|uniref:Methionine ABC transporter substrate-binding protein n=1 Tax=Evansella alkalicola TaxID=745819 RepID=A0ABS6JT35_9BACI|nr:MULTISPECIES: MetQ/NlpA family ABC transporter substrate-binding protein [Bacillaceae]MBU9721585.1 methionine ABC transporter substrate-binding protein [Bacillus alkalicola]
MKKLLFTILSIGMLGLVAACGEESTTGQEKNSITVGFGVGTYEEQFREAILPIMEEKGYEVEIRTFSQNMQLNPAMHEGSIDASVFQSTAYMEGINEDQNMNMTGVAFVPGAPQGLYSVNHDSFDDVQDGTTVALPNDPVNQERAVRILEDLGWVKIKEDAGTIDFNLSSVEPDLYDIDFQVLDPAQILVSLEDVDFGVVNGNYIANSGRRIAEALKIENTPMEHRIILSVNEGDKDTQWAQDLVAAYESREFEEYILSQSKYDGFILPEAWENN